MLKAIAQHLSEYDKWIYLKSDAIEAVRFTLTNPSAGTGTLRMSFRRKEKKNPSITPRKNKVEGMTTAYDYFHVPEQVFLTLLRSRTPMPYFVDSIRNRFAYKRLSEDEAKTEDAVKAAEGIIDSPDFDVDESVIDDLGKDDNLFSSMVPVGLEKQAQTASPVELAISNMTARLRDESSQSPYLYATLSMRIRPIENGFETTIERQFVTPGADPYTSAKRYNTRIAAVTMLTAIFRRHFRVNPITQVPLAKEQHDLYRKVNKREYEYFIRPKSVGDGQIAYVIERSGLSARTYKPSPVSVHPEDAELMNNTAFSFRDDAVNYLCSFQFVDYAIAGNSFVVANRETAGQILPYSLEGNPLHLVQSIGVDLREPATVYTGHSLLEMGEQKARELLLSSSTETDILPDDILLVFVDHANGVIDTKKLEELDDMGWVKIRRDLHVVQFRHRNADPDRARPTRPPSAPQAEPTQDFDIEIDEGVGDIDLSQFYAHDLQV